MGFGGALGVRVLKSGISLELSTPYGRSRSEKESGHLDGAVQAQIERIRGHRNTLGLPRKHSQAATKSGLGTEIVAST
jgi:hypothetical protein